eukprot:scaffold530880_cov25-Prasinocladus_malaysianus.AAC.1
MGQPDGEQAIHASPANLVLWPETSSAPATSIPVQEQTMPAEAPDAAGPMDTSADNQAMQTNAAVQNFVGAGSA